MTEVFAAGAIPAAWPAWPRRAALLLVALGASLPFLVPLHVEPIPTFYGEWVAAGLGLLLFAVCAVQQRRVALPLPGILLLPGLFLIAIGVQLLLGRIHFPQQALLYALYLLLAAMAMVCGRTLAEALGCRAVMTALAVGLLLGSLWQGVPVALQLQGVFAPAIAMPLLPGRTLYGNLAQANQLADYLYLGVVAGLYLFTTGRIGAAAATASIGALVLMAPLTGSRSVLLYPLGLAVLGVMAWPRLRRLPAADRLRRAGLLTLSWALLAFWLPPLLHRLLDGDSDGFRHSGVAAERLIQAMAQLGGVEARLDLWATAWRSIMERPWLGGGVGSVPLASLEFAGAAGQPVGVAEHFHQLLLQWAAEFGLPVALLSTLLLMVWAVRATRRQTGPEWLAAAGLLTVIGLHSLLEYPLWHAYFLWPAALLLGAFGEAHDRLRIRGVIAVALLAAVPLAVLLMHQLRVDHGRLWAAVALVPQGEQAERIWRARIDDLLSLHRESLFSPYVNGMLVVAMDIDRDQLPAKDRLCEAALRFSPGPGVVFKCAAIRTLAGRPDDGRRLLRQGERVFPGEAARFRQELGELAARFPELAAVR